MHTEDTITPGMQRRAVVELRRADVARIGRTDGFDARDIQAPPGPSYLKPRTDAPPREEPRRRWSEAAEAAYEDIAVRHKPPSSSPPSLWPGRPPA